MREALPSAPSPSESPGSLGGFLGCHGSTEEPFLQRRPAIKRRENRAAFYTVDLIKIRQVILRLLSFYSRIRPESAMEAARK